MIGSSISAIATYLMRVEVPAPHGGFLILGLVNKPVVWVFCILLGSLVGAVLYILATPVAKKDTAQWNVENELSLFKDILKEETICLSLKNTGKEEVIDEMVAMLYADGVLQDAEAYKKEIMKREKISSTAFGNGIAIPHGKSQAVRMPRVAVGLSKNGVLFDSSDGEPVYAVFMIAVGENEDEVHLKLLSALSKKLMDPGFLSRLKECTGKDQITRLITEE
jgi:PTS system fructose-specific IIC component